MARLPSCALKREREIISIIRRRANARVIHVKFTISRARARSKYARFVDEHERGSSQPPFGVPSGSHLDFMGDLSPSKRRLKRYQIRRH